jgi:hypothetical protein
MQRTRPGCDPGDIGEGLRPRRFETELTDDAVKTSIGERQRRTVRDDRTGDRLSRSRPQPVCGAQRKRADRLARPFPFQIS